MNGIFQDVRFAIRKLRRNLGFTLITAGSLALGIGATSAIYSLYDQMLLRTLPVHEPDRLVNLSAPGPTPGAVSCNTAGPCTAVFSYPMFRDLGAGQEAFTELAAHRQVTAHVSIGDQTRTSSALLVSGSYFPLLRLRPALGRLLDPEDTRTIDDRPVAVLSHSFWMARLGADPSILNGTIHINGYPFTVVGVAPEGFTGTVAGHTPDVFVPLTMRRQLTPEWRGFEQWGTHWLYLVGRLRPGVSAAQAEQSINTLYAALLDEFEAPLYADLNGEELQRVRAKRIVLSDGARGQGTLLDYARTPLAIFLAITVFVLLIACANIANLLLAQGARRGRELAIRQSVGASRARLVSQLLVDSWLLALLGAIAGLLVARWTLAVIVTVLPAEVAAGLEFGLRPSVLAFTAAVAIGAGLVFGIYPALQATGMDLIAALKAEGRRASNPRAASRFRAALVTGQIALSVMLLVVAGLFIKSLVNVSRIDPGFHIDDVITFSLNPSLNRYDPEASRALFERLGDELSTLPGIVGLSASFSPLLSEGGWTREVSVEGLDAGTGASVMSGWNDIGPDFFRTLGIPVLAGRDFGDADALNAPRVAIVNQAFVRRIGLDERDAIGRRIALGRDRSDFDIEIVGVVPDAHYNGIKKAAMQPMLFTAWRQNPAPGGLTFYVRTPMDPEQAVRAIRSVVQRLDPHLPVDRLQMLHHRLDEVTTIDRIIGSLAGAFAILATLLAALGLYGVLAYDVARRTPEIGVRMAVGATAGGIRWLVARQVGRMVLGGSVVGVALALGLGGAAQSLLFGIDRHDPQVIGFGVVIVCAVALIAAYLPIRRATRIDPVVAFRTE